MTTNEFPFDPSCGWSKRKLLELTPSAGAPTDFADFWRTTYDETITLQPIPLGTN